jgi:hypothetical protein
MTHELGPLPPVDYDAGWHRIYTADQMRDYAAAQVAAAVAKERERWGPVVMAMQDAVLDTMASGRPIAHLDSACDALVKRLAPNPQLTGPGPA